MLVTELLFVVVMAMPLMFTADAASNGNDVPGLPYLATITRLGLASTVVGAMLMNGNPTRDTNFTIDEWSQGWTSQPRARM